MYSAPGIESQEMYNTLGAGLTEMFNTPGIETLEMYNTLGNVLP